MIMNKLALIVYIVFHTNVPPLFGYNNNNETDAKLPLFTNSENNFKNILLITIDDLRHLSDTDDFLHIPNIEDLAGKSVNFKSAYAQQALCAPSRNSLLTGRRPDSLHLYDFYSYWRDSVGNYTTLPQLFKEQGYRTFSVGKVFHPGLSSNFTDDYPYSWSIPPYHPSTEKYKESAVCSGSGSDTKHADLICPVDVNIQPEKTLPDLQSLQRAIEILQEQNSSGPYFLAIGFHKPHIPLKCPKEYLGLYPLDLIQPARQPYRPYSMPLVAWHPWTDVRKRDDIATLNISFPFGPMPNLWAKKIKQNYFSCVSYIDDLLGQLLGHINTENTIVVLVSDHGWSLGENGLWAKYSNFDIDVKVPLIFNIPGRPFAQISEPVELIDVFPTLVELAGLHVDIPKCAETSNTHLCFEGKSLVHLMNSKSSNYESIKYKSEYIALSQYPRPGMFPQKNSDKPRLYNIRIMGYSLRTERFRYTEWIGFNGTLFTRNWSDVYGVELYDHSIDKYESINLYNRPGLDHIVHYFASLLRRSFMI